MSLDLNVKKILKTINMLDEDTEMVLDSAERLFEEKISEEQSRKWEENEKCYVENGVTKLPESSQEVFDAMAEQGLFGLFIPVDYEGGGMSYTSATALVEMLSSYDAGLGVALAIHTTCSDAIEVFGTEKQKSMFLEKLALGECIGGVAYTEAGAGTDIGGGKATAEDKEDYYLVNGEKIFITTGGIKGNVLISTFKTTNKEGKQKLSAFIFDADEEGIRREGFKSERLEDKLGIRSSPTAVLSYTDVKLPKDRLLGDEHKGVAIALYDLDGGRITIAAQALGITKKTVEKTFDYVRERQQFRQEIIKFDKNKIDMAKMLTNIKAMELMTYNAAWIKDNVENENRKRPAYHIEACQAKLFCSEKSVEITRKCVELHGGYGYTKEYLPEKLARDAQITTIYEGTSNAQRLAMANDLVTAYLSLQGDVFSWQRNDLKMLNGEDIVESFYSNKKEVEDTEFSRLREQVYMAEIMYNSLVKQMGKPKEGTDLNKYSRKVMNDQDLTFNIADASAEVSAGKKLAAYAARLHEIDPESKDAKIAKLQAELFLSDTLSNVKTKLENASARTGNWSWTKYTNGQNCIEKSYNSLISDEAKLSEEIIRLYQE